jgi:hypothetical protein
MSRQAGGSRVFQASARLGIERGEVSNRLRLAYWSGGQAFDLDDFLDDRPGFRGRLPRRRRGLRSTTFTGQFLALAQRIFWPSSMGTNGSVWLFDQGRYRVV